MPNGGFKAFAYDFSTNSSATDAEKHALCKQVLSSVGEGLVGLNQGWSFSNQNQSDNQPIEFSFNGNDKKSYGLIFNHTSGAKMMLHYNVLGVGIDPSCFLRPASANNTAKWYTANGGLSISVIPPGIGDYDIGKSVVIPDNVMRLCGNTKGTTNATTGNVATSVIQGNTGSYRVIMSVNNDMINLVILDQTNKSCQAYSAGNILNCAWDDTSAYRNYGIICYNNANTASEEKFELNGTNGIRLDSMNGSNSYVSTTSMCQVYSKEGVLMSGLYDARCGYNKYSNVVLCHNQPYLSSCIAGTSSNIRFRTFELYAAGDGSTMCNDKDGYKGIIKPEVACYTKKSLLTGGTILDSGNFMYIMGGLIMGWDPSNTISLYS